jgi:transposase
MEVKMPKAYSIDFREKVLQTYLNKEDSISNIAVRFKMSESTVKRIARQHRETGEIKLFLHHAGRHELIDEAGKETLKKLLAQQGDMTLAEIQENYFKVHGIKPVLAVFHRVLKKMKMNYKKKSHFAQQQLSEEIKKKREEFIEFIQAEAIENLIVLDESGAHLAMSRERGRCFGGTRLYCPRPYHRGSKYSIISAISSSKIVASLYCEGSVDGEFFSGFIEQCLVPELRAHPQRSPQILDNKRYVRY